jgi:hypothetical protein
MTSKGAVLLAIAACCALASAAGDNLDYWLQHAQPAASQPAASQPAASQPAQTQPASAPSGEEAAAARGEDLPGVVEFSDGKVLAGFIHTTPQEPWAVYVEGERRWRLLPPLAVLSITAVVDEERMEQEWRWAGMGQSEKVYTGRQYPFRRCRWRFHLIDGSEVVGTVKGQPFWVVAGGRRSGPYVLHERDKGPMGSTLAELVYVKRLIISRRAMLQAASQPSSRPVQPGG